MDARTEQLMISHAVMDAVMDPIFVLIHDDQISDCNAAAGSLLNLPLSSIRGARARQLFATWPSAIQAALDYPEAETEIDLEQPRQRSYRISVVSGQKLAGQADLRILMFTDISGIRQLTGELSAMNENLETLVRQRTASLRIEVERRKAAEAGLRALNAEMATTQKEVLLTLSGVVELRSQETANHVRRVAELTRLLASIIQLPDAEVDILASAAPMHDIGKIAVPDTILCKPGLLTAAERSHMQQHSQTGYDILRHSERTLLKVAATIAHEHHERWDGSGYPRGLSGTNIALSGRIVAICDVFDALINPRVYKSAWPAEKVREQFHQDSGKAFDPTLTAVLLKNFSQALAINQQYQ